MSWWDTGREDDVIGDAPADLMIGVLQEISEKRKEQSKPNPSLQELADSFVKAMQDSPLDDRGEQREPRLVIKRSGGRDISGNPENADQQLVASIRAGLQRIAAKYQERWHRNPRPSEVAEILSFALASQAERYLTVSEGDLEIDQILAA